MLLTTKQLNTLKELKDSQFSHSHSVVSTEAFKQVFEYIQDLQHQISKLKYKQDGE